MRTAAIPLCIAALVPLFAAGCGPDTPTAFSAHALGHGDARLYRATLDEAWTATHIALLRDRDGAIEEHFEDQPTEPFMVTYNRGSRPPSNLDQIGVWFLPEGTKGTLVKVVVMTGVESTAGIVGPDEASVHRDIATELARIREEKREAVEEEAM
jgi:hypothetical protein